MESKQSYYATIPSYVLDAPISANSKILFIYISSLCCKEGYCWAGNNYLGEKLGLTKVSISRLISQLEKAELIKVEVDKKAGNQRRIYLTSNVNSHIKNDKTPNIKNDNTPLIKNDNHNSLKVNGLKENKKDLVYPFDTKEFLEAWGLWKIYKKTEKGFKFKSLISEQAALKKLSQIADTDQDAINIINQSIENGWSGLFASKQKHNGQVSNYDLLTD